MKRLALTAAVLFLAACGAKTEEAAPAADSVAPAAMPAPATDSAAPKADSAAATDSTKK
jgi:hypothetical protein